VCGNGKIIIVLLAWRVVCMSGLPQGGIEEEKEGTETERHETERQRDMETEKQRNRKTGSHRDSETE
jgi:hypothetical protein